METNIGNFITDVMLKGMKADLAVLNSGTLRADAIIEAGPIRMRDLVNILPMLDELCLLQLTGEQILQVLENSVSQYPRLEGRFAQVSGVTFTFDAKGSPGSRVLRDTVKIGGAALEHQRCYKLCTKDYLRQGKDGYDVFRDAVCLADGEQAGILPSMVREHFKAIEALNGDAPEASTAMAGRALSRQASKRQATMDLSRIGEGPECTKRFAIAPQVEGRVVCLNPAT
ncbi:unnamed protein product [Prorocentrum cordatum]|uniref:5'-Nucleotidase C-terminal domain-containing protein n=1 Tax=Prorocentrum cordatum TaxID=2364126 RepID=A0ABN9PAQ9_9DINO|nr:unnamed protein product [Polarella glacialis]